MTFPLPFPWRNAAIAASLLLAGVPAAHAQSGAAPQPGQLPITTLQVRSELVVVDIGVTDSKGVPLHNLKQSDFTLLENGVSQQIKGFDEHSAMSAAEAAKLTPMPKLGPGIFTNFSPAPANGTVNVLLLDALNTPTQDQAYVRAQLLEYLKNAPPGTRIAIFGLTSHLSMLQGFTSDPDVLKGAVKNVGTKASPLLDDPGSSGASSSMSEAFGDALGSDPSSSEILANLQQFEAEQASFQIQLRAKYTLDAMNQLARYLASVPGKKNLIWFSGSFPLNILPDPDIKDPFSVVADSQEEFRETTNLLARSHVAVYPIDARGLMTSSTFSATNSGSKYATNPGALLKDEGKFFSDTEGEHGTMYQMAADTGGHAFVNTNGLSEAVTKAIDSGSNYYTVSYTPSNTKWNGGFRKIQVELARKGYTLTYRRGYYADDPAKEAKPGVESAATAPAHVAAMKVAMMRGAPDPTEILFKVRILPASAAVEEKVADGNAPNPRSPAKGPYRRYVVDFAADPRAIEFTASADGHEHCEVEFATFVYDRDGVLINTVGSTIKSNLPAASYAALMRAGLPFHLEISVPAKGEYFLRSAVHDVTSDRVGAVEVPVAAVARLAPAGTPAKN
jgi:VWFA-related protein